ncbi:MAG TPA: DHHA1 domain-containing protein [Terriglobales bacterium]|jgi:alanyl-tRNA synthetase|nr:DHHA1 domain-containing protein [Terriglobales bacterium]
MTKRLYYDSSEIHEFDSVVEAVIPPSPEQSRPAVMLRETAFYPTSGGQVHDTGWLTLDCAERLRVAEVVDAQDGRVLHYLEAPAKLPAVGIRVSGSVDPERRRDHMQQHSGQHILSAAFIELYQMPTVSFHMAEDYCSIDLATPAVSSEQMVGAEKRANQIVFENRRVQIRYVSRAEAEELGLRKLPPAERDELRLIEFKDFDLTACGGTHVGSSGQIGSILLRKSEKVRQGIRVEFVCGDRAIRTARRDHRALSEAAALFSAKLWDVPDQIRKNLEENKLLRKQKNDVLDQLVELTALAAVRDQPETNGRRIIVKTFTDRDIDVAKLFVQKVTRAGMPVIALVASTVDSPGLVFGQTPAQANSGAAASPVDMGGLLKQVLSSVGGHGGGSRDFAQGGVPAGCNVEQLLQRAASAIGA